MEKKTSNGKSTLVMEMYTVVVVYTVTLTCTLIDRSGVAHHSRAQRRGED